MELDIVGDVHGHADALEALLKKLGYHPRGRAWRHPQGRRVAFLGDLIDRGPRQRDTLSIVRAMIEAGSALAVMGNHELNAIAYATPDPHSEREHLRRRRGKNIRQHAAFLDAVGGADSALHREWIDFFRTLPLWLDLERIRLVHACWCPSAMARLAPCLDLGNRLTDDGLLGALEWESPAFVACETLLKGPEIALPSGISYRDAHGIERRRARSRWWDAEATTIRAASVEASIADQLPDDPLPRESVIRLDGSKPVVFGHYWMTGTPRLLSPMRACLDFSIARGGVLCAYRFDGESRLDPDRLVWVG